MAGVKKQKKAQRPIRKISAIKKSVAGIGKKISKGADRVVDIILEDNQKVKGPKTKKIAHETVSMFKEAAKQLKENIKDVRPRDFCGDAAYGVGKISGKTKQVFRDIVDGLLKK